MSPEGRNVDNSYPLGLEVAAVLVLAPFRDYLRSVLRISLRSPQIISAWRSVVQLGSVPLCTRIAIAALTAALTALGTTSCMGMGPF